MSSVSVEIRFNSIAKDILESGNSARSSTLLRSAQHYKKANG